MNKLIIDIGNHTTRALFYNGRTRRSAPVHLSLNNELLIPTAAVINDNNEMIAIGEEAILWKISDPAKYYSLDDITNEELLLAFVTSSIEYVLTKLDSDNTQILELTILLSPNCNYAYIDSSKIQKNALSKYGIKKVNLIKDSLPICKKVHSLKNDGEYALLCDVGHSQASLSIIQRQGTQLIPNNFKLFKEFNGTIIESCINKKLEDNVTLPEYQDVSQIAVYNQQIDALSRFIKLLLSKKETCKVPVPGTEDVCSLSRRDLEKAVMEPMTNLLNAILLEIRDSSIDVSLLKNIILHGPTFSLPFIEELLVGYLTSNLRINKNSIEIINVTRSEEYPELVGCYGALL